MNDPEEPTMFFTVSGGFCLPTNVQLKPVHSADGRIIGYTLPDGREARLIVGLEVEGEGGVVETITNENRMAELGFGGLSYDYAEFEEG